MTNPKPLERHFVVGNLRNPALEDHSYRHMDDALKAALEYPESDVVVCIWDERGETVVVVYQGEVFKRM